MFLCIVALLHTSSGTLTERKNVTKNGLAMANFEMEIFNECCRYTYLLIKTRKLTKIEQRCYNNHELGCCIESGFACS